MELKEKIVSSYVAFENGVNINSDIHAIRTEALKKFESLGFPTKKLEAWKYTSLNSILKEYNIANVITDSAGRRDLLHMRLTSDTAFIRYNGANHDSDYTRLDDWVDRLEDWYDQGLKNVYFFVHQNLEEASPLLSAHFINKMNERFGLSIKIPQTLNK